MHNSLVAPLDKNIGDGLAQFQTLCDRKQMVLTFGRSILDQIIVIQLLRIDEYRLGHLDRIIEGKQADKLRRSTFHAAEPMRELCPGFDLDICGQPASTSSNSAICSLRITA